VASKAVTVRMPDTDQAIQVAREAAAEFFRPETGYLVIGVFAEPLAEKFAFTTFRSVFGNSGEGLSESERIARQVYRLILGMAGAYIAATSKDKHIRAMGTGFMAEAAVNLLKGFGLAIV